MHLPISWWVIYGCTCSHRTECSPVFNWKRHDPRVPPSLFTWSHPKPLFFVFPQMKNPQRETFCQCGRGETKNSRSTQRHQNKQVQKLFWAVEKTSWYVHCIKWRVLWRWLKFKHVRISTQFFINKFYLGFFIWALHIFFPYRYLIDPGPIFSLMACSITFFITQVTIYVWIFFWIL